MTPRLVKKLKSNLSPIVHAPWKLEVYLHIKCNYLFWVQMAGLLDTLVLEMVKRREAKERMVAAKERLMKWIEVMDMESDREDSEDLE